MLINVFRYLSAVCLKQNCLQETDYYPWEAANVDKELVKEAFDNVIVITAHGYDRKYINHFQKRFADFSGLLTSEVFQFLLIFLGG